MMAIRHLCHRVDDACVFVLMERSASVKEQNGRFPE